MKVLISGAAGFLGSHLTDAFLARGDEVIAADCFWTGRRENLAGALGNPNFHLVEWDIRHMPPASIVKEKFDIVCNLACPASPPSYLKIPVETLETCSIGTRRMLDLALGNHARFFHTSTSEVYGDPQVHPQPESYAGNVQSYHERSCYDEGKRYAEALIYQYRHTKGVDTRLVRIFNTYGPRMHPRDGRVISTFVRQALQNKPITIAGDGEQTRSFCFVSDLIRGFLSLIDSRKPEAGGPVNIGNPEEFTINQLVEVLEDVLGRPVKQTHIDRLPGDPGKRKPDITLATRLLNWQPEVNLKEGLSKTIEYMKEKEKLS